MKRSLFLASAAAVAALPSVAPAAQLVPAAQPPPIYLRLVTSYPGYAPALHVAEFDVTGKSVEWIRETIKMMTRPIGYDSVHRHVAHAAVYSPGGIQVKVSTFYGDTDDAIVSAVLGYQESNKIWTEWLNDVECENEPITIVRDERDGSLIETFRNLLRYDPLGAAVRRENASPIPASIAN